jgi:hypothetical protein
MRTLIQGTGKSFRFRCDQFVTNALPMGQMLREKASIRREAFPSSAIGGDRFVTRRGCPVPELLP